MSKGKTKAWRKIQRQVNPETGQVERYGRRFRNAMLQFNQMKPTGYPLLNTLLARAGVYEVTVAAQPNDNDITDVEEITSAA